jgi:hypothetical protein
MPPTICGARYIQASALPTWALVRADQNDANTQLTSHTIQISSSI